MPAEVNQIISMPIFLGLTREELDEIASQAYFIIRRVKKGISIIDEYEACESLVAVTDGWINTTTYSDDRSYNITELTPAPLLIEPDKLFGMKRHYHSSYTAYTTCTVITLPKEELTILLEKYMIVRLNYLNIICRKAQQADTLPWQHHIPTPRSSIIQFIRQHSMYPAGKKTLHINMKQLANELNFKRLAISKALNALEQEEKIILRRGIIEIPALQLLNT